MLTLRSIFFKAWKDPHFLFWALIIYLEQEILFCQAEQISILVKLTIWGTLVSLTKPCSLQTLHVPTWLLQTALTRKIDLAKTSLLVDSGFSFSFLTTLSRHLPITHFDFDGFVSLQETSFWLSYKVLFFFYVLPFMMDFLHCHPAILSYRILEIIQPLISNWVKYLLLF